MNRDRKILLTILFFSLVISLSVINLTILNDRNRRNQASIDALENQYARLQKGGRDIPPEILAEMEMIIEGEKLKYIAREDSDPYKLGLEIIALLERRGISVVQYKTLDLKEGYLLEFTVSSEAVSFFSFWRDFSKKDKYFNIPYFSVRNEKDGLSSTFRIGYAAYE